MYRLGRRSKKKAKKHVWFGILIVLIVPLLVGALVLVKLLQEDDPAPTTPQAITREYASQDASVSKVFDQDTFKITLPSDWRLKDHTTTQYNLYSFEATLKTADARSLEIFVDRLPPERAFNRMLPVSIDSNKLIVTGSVSENCTAFTGSQGPGQVPAAGVDKLPAKWQGVQFFCDMANYSRNNIGVGSVGSRQRLTLAGPTTGQHVFFFVYIDHSANPDYQILESALSSLEVK